MGVKVKQLGSDLRSLGEGPHWVAEENALYFIDIIERSVHRYDATTEKFTSAKVEGAPSVSFVVPATKGTNHNTGLFVIGSGLSLSLIEWDGQSATVRTVEELAKVTEHQLTGRLNDGKADYTGRLYTGSMALEGDSDFYTTTRGVLVSWEPSTGVVVHQRSVGISNGLAWNQTKKKMYFSDSLKYNVREYDYDEGTGKLSNERLVIDIKDPAHGLPDCLPDGMTIDAEGNLWIALFNGSRVIKVNPSLGNILQTVSIPTSQVTSACWGGDQLQDLYITTANVASQGTGLNAAAGATYRVTGLQVEGTPSYNVKICNK